MNLLEAYNSNKTVSGFTLIEVMLVMALMFIIGVFVSPIGISFYNSQLLNETSDGLAGALRQAQTFALTGKDNQKFGVYIQDEEYVIFAGENYASRTVDEDLVFPIASTVTIVSPSEIVFDKLSGEPNVVGTIVISLDGKERQINVSESGNIDR